MTITHSTRSVTEESFLKDVAKHQPTVLHDDGVHRHIRLSVQGTYFEHFDLVTWPGYLAYSGDRGCFVFSRLHDMFEFFRVDRNDWHYNKKGGLSINLGYWSEKLQAVDGGSSTVEGCKGFSEDRFNRAVIGDLVEWMRCQRSDTTRDERRELWNAVVSEVIGAYDDNYRKQCAAHDFHHQVRPGLEFYFQDFFEHTITDYTDRFIWCCYAIAWGILQYDNAKKVVDAREAV